MEAGFFEEGRKHFLNFQSKGPIMSDRVGLAQSVACPPLARVRLSAGSYQRPS